MAFDSSLVGKEGPTTTQIYLGQTVLWPMWNLCGHFWY